MIGSILKPGDCRQAPKPALRPLAAQWASLPSAPPTVSGLTLIGTARMMGSSCTNHCAVLLPVLKQEPIKAGPGASPLLCTPSPEGTRGSTWRHGGRGQPEKIECEGIRCPFTATASVSTPSAVTTRPLRDAWEPREEQLLPRRCQGDCHRQ